MNKVLTVCPCCGNRSAETRRIGVPCNSCGAHRVGEPLARTSVEMPTYGRALVALVLPVLLPVLFFAPTAAKVYQGYASFDRQTIETELLTFAWWLRWVLPVAALIVLWSVAKLNRAVRVAPARFAGQTIARAGVVLSVLVLAASLALIGGQMPERQREARIAAEAHQNAQLYRANSLFLKYRASFGAYPSRLEDLRRLPDTDGSIANVIANFDGNSYKPSSAPTANAQIERLPSLTRNVRFLDHSNDVPPKQEILSFTSYELVAPGADEKLGTWDDRVMRDGMIVVPSSSPDTSKTLQFTR